MLTIAIPVFERKDFFDEALGSALAQTRPVQVIVVDNASSHDYFEKAVKNCGFDFVRYYRNDTNLGMYGNWNQCIGYCKTDYVIILGDDDIIEPEFASVFYEALERYPDLLCFHAGIKKFGDAAGNNEVAMRGPLGYHSGTDMLKKAAKDGLGIWTVAMAFATKVYPEFKFEYPQWAYSQDWLFAYQAFANGHSYGDERKLVNYRVHSKGNAIKVGAKASLSAVLVFEAIGKQLAEKGIKEHLQAKQKEKWIVRNSIISGFSGLILEMMEERGNPFGEKIKHLLKQDSLSRAVISAKGRKSSLIILFMKLLRKIQYS
jgi:glycosyltransferase involved in cell wall biosynthesis